MKATKRLDEAATCIQHMGPSITDNEDGGIIKAFRNIPGVTLLNVSKLNILKLLVVMWDVSAFGWEMLSAS